MDSFKAFVNRSFKKNFDTIFMRNIKNIKKINYFFFT